MSGETRIPVNGARLVPDISGALVWREKQTLIVADLHLEKGSSFGRQRRHLPPYDSLATLDRLEAALDRNRPQRVICLGDSFHDREAARRLDPGTAYRLRTLTAQYDWIWIAGNHDPIPRENHAGLGGRWTGEATVGGIIFRHEARGGDIRGGEVSGHYHPKAVLQVRGRRLTARCFVSDGRRLILPAFGAYTGGLDIRSPEIRNLFAKSFRVYFLGRKAVYEYDGVNLFD